MPASFLPSTSTSFGHLMATFDEMACAATSRTASPAASVNAPACSGPKRGRRSTEKVRFSEGGELQR
jgi:hypothetical protein